MYSSGYRVQHRLSSNRWVMLAGLHVLVRHVFLLCRINSTLRHQLLPKCQPTYAGYLAWRGIAPAEQLSGEVQHLLTGKAAMYKVGSALHAVHWADIHAASCASLCMQALAQYTQGGFTRLRLLELLRWHQAAA